MKPFTIILSFLICSFVLYGQDLNVHKYINKNKSEVIKQYGKPVHQDNSNPAMICMFYKSSAGQMIFVSDNVGVYQSEATVIYDNEGKAQSALDNFILNSVTDGFAVDSVTTKDFHLEKSGVKVELQLFENKLTKKIEVRVKANRRSY